MRNAIDRDTELLNYLRRAETYQEMVAENLNRDDLLCEYETLLDEIELTLRECGFTYKNPLVLMSEAPYTTWASVIENVTSTEGTKDKRKLKKRHNLLRDCLFYHKHWLDQKMANI